MTRAEHPSVLTRVLSAKSKRAVRRKTGGPAPEKPVRLSTAQLEQWFGQLEQETPYTRAWGLLGGKDYFIGTGQTRQKDDQPREVLDSGERYGRDWVFSEDRQALFKAWMAMFMQTLPELSAHEQRHFRQMWGLRDIAWGDNLLSVLLRDLPAEQNIWIYLCGLFVFMLVVRPEWLYPDIGHYVKLHPVPHGLMALLADQAARLLISRWRFASMKRAATDEGGEFTPERRFWSQEAKNTLDRAFR